MFELACASLLHTACGFDERVPFPRRGPSDKGRVPLTGAEISSCLCCLRCCSGVHALGSGKSDTADIAQIQ